MLVQSKKWMEFANSGNKTGGGGGITLALGLFTGGAKIVYAPAAGANNNVSILVDNNVSAIPGTSVSVGVTASEGFSVGSQLVATQFGPLEFQVTPGVSHTFSLGLWTSAGTATYPYQSIGQFGCREVSSK